MKNRELFQRDPTAARLMNNGQARIDDARTARERDPEKNDCVLVTAGVGVPTSAMILGKLG